MGPSTLVDGDGLYGKGPLPSPWASMGPSTLVDGDIATSSRLEDVGTRRQWGRRLSSTETRFRAPRRRLERLASMGPSTLVDGDDVVFELDVPRVLASMGPSTLVDGDRPARAGPAHCGDASMGPSTLVDG